MSEGADYDPGPWRSTTFKDAENYYTNVHAGRSYAKATKAKKTVKDLLPESLTTNSPYPLILAGDETSSMSGWPGIIFAKLGLMDNERKFYYDDSAEVSFAAIGDAQNGETYPLQVRPFAKGIEMKTRVEELVMENKGGGNDGETYELLPLYLLHNFSAPFAVIKPVVILIGDEAPLDEITIDIAEEYAHVKLDKTVKTSDVFKEAQKKFAIYVILKPYGSDGTLEPMDNETAGFYARWVKLVGKDHIALLASPERVVDVILGILAKESGRIDYFREEIEGRQERDKVDTVYKALETIHKLGPGNPPKSKRGGSTLHMPLTGKSAKPLLPGGGKK
jgi:hypothetical protein